MKRIKLLICTTFIMLALLSCSDNLFTPHQKLYFEVHYINYAWGYQNTGFLIDSSGYVRRFDLSHNVYWNYVDSLGFISDNKMDENIALCDTIITQIKADTLQYYVTKINDAGKGNISNPENYMYDAGEIEYVAYIFNAKTYNYRKILLFTWGDIEQTNNAPAANEIFQWLRRIQFGK